MTLNPTVAIIARPLLHALIAPVALLASLGTSGILPAVVWVALASAVYSSRGIDAVRRAVFFFIIRGVLFSSLALVLWFFILGIVGGAQ